MGKWDAVTFSVLVALSEDFIEYRLQICGLETMVLGTGCGEVLELFLYSTKSRRSICVSVCEFFIQP